MVWVKKGSFPNWGCQAEPTPSAWACSRRPSALQAKSPTPEPQLAMPTSVPRRAAVMVEGSFTCHLDETIGRLKVS